MRVLGDAWLDGYLDEALLPGHVRVQVTTWKTLAPVADLYFVRPRNPRLVLSYLRDLGFVSTLRKVVSRSRESLRNRKFLSCGIGIITDVGTGTARRTGQWVLFVAPAHPQCAERVVLSEELTRPVTPPSALPSLSSLTHIDVDDHFTAPWLQPLSGWSPHSGTPADDSLGTALDAVPELLSASGGRPRVLPTGAAPVRERTVPVARRQGDSRPNAVLFGLGNYAKTVVLPEIAKHIRVECIHELDPTQIGRWPSESRSVYDSSPSLRSDEKYDAVFIAGFHHTHGDLAVDAMARGAAAVVEKPIVTTHDQLERVLTAMRKHQGRLFACFQRRYLPCNTWVRSDLVAPKGAAISYHAIVFEVPLPASHWYRWPNSGSRLISNGCHWIDHFLFLNNFAPVRRQQVFQGPDGTVNLSLELENEAFFTMVLTDRGANRTGVRDYVELRTSDATATLTNGTVYRVERGLRVVRSTSTDRMTPYRNMYRAIARAIATGASGDSARSIESSSRAVLDFEAELRQSGRPSSGVSRAS